MRGDIIGRIQELYTVEFIWVQEKETRVGKIDTEFRNWIIVPESSDVNWDIDLEIIVKTSIVCTLITKVITYNWPYKISLHKNNLICAVPESTEWKQPKIRAVTQEREGKRL